MNGIARMPADKRAEVFAETADRKGLPEAIIEKDFWVCWVLKQLFSIEVLSDRLLFEGWDIAVKDLPCHKPVL